VVWKNTKYGRSLVKRNKNKTFLYDDDYLSPSEIKEIVAKIIRQAYKDAIYRGDVPAERGYKKDAINWFLNKNPHLFFNFDFCMSLLSISAVKKKAILEKIKAEKEEQERWEENYYSNSEKKLSRREIARILEDRIFEESSQLQTP